jgi:hypothetical protein
MKQDFIGDHPVMRNIKGQGVKFDVYFIPGIKDMKKHYQ